MEIWTEQDSEDTESWISLTGDDSAETESPTWRVEMYVALEGVEK